MFSAILISTKLLNASLVKLSGIFSLVLLISLSASAQTSGKVVYSETFPNSGFPANWSISSSVRNLDWMVAAGGADAIGTGQANALNFKRGSGKTLSNVNVWAFSSAINLPAGKYTIRFNQQNIAGGSAAYRLILNTSQSYNGTGVVTISSGTFVPKSDWVTFEYEIAVTTANTYYIGLGVTGVTNDPNFFIDEIKITEVREFYNKSGADLSLLTSWGANLDGSGIQPLSFTEAGQIFNIRNYTSNATLTMSQNLGVSGESSKVVLGNGSAPVSLHLTNGKTYLNLMDVLANATLSINANAYPKLGMLSDASTVIFGVDVPASITEGFEFGTVIFNSSKKSNFNRKIKINGRLELKNSKLDLGDYDLELGPNATVLNGSASTYVVLSGKGRLRKSINAGAPEVELPVGNATYNPVKIKLAAGSENDVFSVGVLDGVYGAYTNDVPNTTTALNSKTVNKTWVISEDVIGGSDIAVTLTWSATDILTGFDPTRCHVKHYEYGAWDADMPVAASVSTMLSGLTSLTTYSVTRTGISSFSPFTVSSEGPTLLPVELLHFAAKATENNTVNLNWTTAMEKNNDFFAVERSQDGKNFTQIAQVKGKGTTNSRTDYSFTDNNPLAGTSYYRLRQVDLDGSFEHLIMRAVTLKGAQSLLLNVYPNPAQGSQVNLQVQGLTAGEEAKLLVSDVMGRSLIQKRVLPGSNLVLATDELKAGTYLVKVVGKAGAQTQKLVIK